MPTYEYLCDACGHNYEIVQKISEDSLKTCPTCGKEALKRIINASAFHLKGSGWYKTDYAPLGTGTGTPSSSSESAGDSKAAGSSSESASGTTAPKTESAGNSSSASTGGTTTSSTTGGTGDS